MTFFTSPRPRARRVAAFLALALVAPAAFLLPGASAATPVYSEGFESGAAGWEGTGLWNLSGDRPGSGNVSWYYGISTAPGTEDNHFDTGAANSGALTSPAIDLTGVSVARLSFWQWWDGEGCPYEHPIVQVATVGNNSTSGFQTVYEECGSSGSGTADVNLTAYAGKVVQIRFFWDTVDGIANQGEGWYVDDVKVFAEALPSPKVDLTVSQPKAPSVIVAGEYVLLSSVLRNLGSSTASNVAVEFLVDGVPVGGEGGLTLAGGASRLVGTVWYATPGYHWVTVRADPGNLVPETNEFNNNASAVIYVFTDLPDLTMDIVKVEKSPVRTDLADLHPHPLARHVVTFEVCNEGTANATYGSVDLFAYGKATSDSLPSGPQGGRYLGSVDLSEGVAVGECVTETFTWDAIGTVGDVTIRASVSTWPERDLSDNADTEDSFVLVGNLGGVVL